MTEDRLLDVLRQAAGAVAEALAAVTDWHREGDRPGQYGLDLVADASAVAVLTGAGLGVLSEESGLSEAGRDLLAVVDPVDGSTNASRRIPWYATSICVLDSNGPLAALVVNQANGWCYEAVRGGGAVRDGRRLKPSGCRRLPGAIVAVSGVPPRPVPWSQTRALGASALDICAVAEGLLDGFCDYGASAHGPWDYLAAMLVCQEAGAAVGEADGRDLVVRDHASRRAPIAASTGELLEALLSFRKIG